MSSYDNDINDINEEVIDDIENEDFSDDGSLLDIDNIEVQIKCEIGKVSLSLAELSNIKVGHTVELIRWPTQLVKLTANNTYFAEGILVDVNGMLGVKILKKLTN